MMPYQLSHEDASREFNWLDAREDVYTESSSSSIVKFLPALAMSDGFCRNALLSTLDVADAFLEVPQAAPRVEKNWQLVGIGDSVMPPWTKGCSQTLVSALYQCVAEEVQCNDMHRAALRVEDSEKVCDGFTCRLFLGGQQFFSSWIERGVQAELNVG
jgi:hypothetical protein